MQEVSQEVFFRSPEKDLSQLLQAALKQTLAKLLASSLPAEHAHFFNQLPVLKLASPQHGDFSYASLLEISKKLKRNPKELAADLLVFLKTEACSSSHEKQVAMLAHAEVAGPGFINMQFSQEFLNSKLHRLLSLPLGSTSLKGKKILMEYVSANPTGPLHIGHGRWAVFGSSLARALSFCSAKVYQEFYVNDTGKQIDKLYESVAAIRSSKPIPEDGYHGEYLHSFKNNTEDPLQSILNEQKETLKKIGVHFDNFFHESSLRTALHRPQSKNIQEIEENTALSGSASSSEKPDTLKHCLDLMESKNLAYHHDGALWFRSSLGGDDKDRVLRKSDGSLTYFALDIAYHFTKLKRGWPSLIDILGADHHGYVKRISIATSLMYKYLIASKEQLQTSQAEDFSISIIIGQLVKVFRGGKEVRMSKRSGDFIALEETIQEIGPDATCYFLSRQKISNSLYFDLEQAKQKNLENPVYYVQYAHARIHAVFRKALDAGILQENLLTNTVPGLPATQEYTLIEQAIPQLLDTPLMLSLEPTSTARRLLLQAMQFSSEIEQLTSSVHAETHHICRWLAETASLFHKLYNEQIFIKNKTTEDKEYSLSMLRLLAVVAKTLKAGLSMLGVSAPNTM